jgi:hypothetical protein
MTTRPWLVLRSNAAGSSLRVVLLMLVAVLLIFSEPLWGQNQNAAGPANTPAQAASPATQSYASEIAVFFTGLATLMTALAALWKAFRSGEAAEKSQKDLAEFKDNFVRQLLEPRNLEILKNQGHLLDTENMGAFEQCAEHILRERSFMTTVRTHGNLVTREDLGESQARIRNLEEVIFDMRILLYRLSASIADEKLREPLLKMADEFHEQIQRAHRDH